MLSSGTGSSLGKVFCAMVLRNKIIVSSFGIICLMFLIPLLGEVPKIKFNQHLFHSYYFHSNHSGKCPDYFKWIDHDLRPWKKSGISQELLEDARSKADFRVVIVNGKLYMERYRFCYQTRAQYTLWGILMLLENFPGLVPDLELMFMCGDRPQVPTANFSFSYLRMETLSPPPLFAYCTTKGKHYDIVFPDWSFWGWPEVNIGPWTLESQKIFLKAKELTWSEREPVAHWKGNTWMGKIRPKLMKCNSTNVRVDHQDWDAESSRNFSSSDLSKQCSYRYKFYVEGIGWSVSLKYIMSCGSTMLQISPEYFEFYSRSLIPYLHFLPISAVKTCKSIQQALEWGYNNPEQASALGKCAQKFLEEQLTMDYVYQYMLLLLQNYAKLLKFKPVPPKGIEPMSLNSSLPWQKVTMHILPSNSTQFCKL